MKMVHLMTAHSFKNKTARASLASKVNAQKTKRSSCRYLRCLYFRCNTLQTVSQGAVHWSKRKWIPTLKQNFQVFAFLLGLRSVGNPHNLDWAALTRNFSHQGLECLLLFFSQVADLTLYMHAVKHDKARDKHLKALRTSEVALGVRHCWLRRIKNPASMSLVGRKAGGR